MRSLGVLAAAEQIRPANKPAPKKKGGKRPRDEPREPTRRSGRVAGKAAENDGAAVDALGDSEEEAAVAEPVDRVAEARAVLAHSRAWLESSRAALAKLGDGVRVGGEDAAWRTEAVRRWGAAVPPALPPGATWETFVASRLTTPPPPSPLDLMQEYYACVLSERLFSRSPAAPGTTLGACSSPAC